MEKSSTQPAGIRGPNRAISKSLSAAIFIGKLNGCIPFETRTRLHTSKILSYFYVAIMAVLQAVTFVYLMVFKVRPTFTMLKLSDAIVLSISAIAMSSAEVLIRIYFIARYSQFRECVARIQALKAEIRPPATATESASAAVYGLCAFWALVITVITLQTVNTATVIWQDGTTNLAGEILTYLIDKVWLGTSVFCTTLFIGLGASVLDSYKCLTAEILVTMGAGAGIGEKSPIVAVGVWHTAVGKILRGTETQKFGHGQGRGHHRLMHLFEETKECFELYNQFAGFLLLTSVFESTALSPAAFYIAVENPYLFGNVTIAGALFLALMFSLRLALVVQLGQTLDDSISKVGKQIRSRLLVVQMEESSGTGRLPVSLPSQDQLLANHILAWNWNLSACDFFDVNYKLFPMVLGSVMTNIMFMFSLKIAEETSGLGDKKKIF